MKALALRITVFLITNFMALWIGGMFTGSGVSSGWYQTLNKAPWTPPGWVFGVAWTTIMICFAIYMAALWSTQKNKTPLIGLFILQWILNVMWNPTFFYFQDVLVALFVITLLTILTGFFLLVYWKDMKLKSALILPYVMWLIIATSLNGYILFYN